MNEVRTPKIVRYVTGESEMISESDRGFARGLGSDLSEFPPEESVISSASAPPLGAARPPP
jgi:hypothetical protein